MAAMTFPERLDRIEDEVQALDSALDSRTRLLWAEITKIRAELEQLKAARTAPEE